MLSLKDAAKGGANHLVKLMSSEFTEVGIYFYVHFSKFY